MTNAEFKKELEDRTKRFAITLLEWLATLPATPVVIAVIRQLAKSGPSIGANYREANRAESANDFAHKIGIVEKESNETVYWLEVLMEANLLSAISKAGGPPLLIEATELLKLFTSISRTTRCNKRALQTTPPTH